MDRNAILPIRIKRDPLACARAAARLSAQADYYRARGRIGAASMLTLALLAIVAGDAHPASVVPVVL